MLTRSLSRHADSFIDTLELRIAPASVFALTPSNGLIVFDAYDPGNLLSSVTISGLQANETILAIDFRPADGVLYGLGSASRLYTINLTTGEATQIGSAFSTTLSGTSFAFDFDPVADRIRVISDTEQNLQLNPETGLQIVDATLSLSGTYTGIAYTNNFPGASATTAYIIDAATNTLRILGGPGGSPSPSTGQITSFGANLNVDPGSEIGFDIGLVFGFETALASFRIGTTSQLYNINLNTGSANLIGRLSTPIVDIAISPVETPGQVNIVNSKTATYRDIDGDTVTVSISKGTLSQAMFNMRKEGANNSMILQRFDLTLDPKAFGANVTISAKRSIFGGDGLVNIGYIRAIGLDLGDVKVTGDLARIDAGGGADHKKSINSLDVQSMGLLGSATQSNSLASSPALLSSILTGGVKKITVRGSVVDASINVLGDIDSSVGSVSIAGDLIGIHPYGGSINVTDGNLGTLKINGSIRGGDAIGSGYVFVSKNLKTMSVLGGIYGGTGGYSGLVFGATLGNATIGGDLRGSTANYSGSLYYNAITGKVTVKGSLVGNSGIGSGSIIAENPPSSQSKIDGTIANVVVGGSLFGGSGKFSGSIRGEELIKSATVLGSLNGNSGDKSGSIYTEQTLVAATVLGDLNGSNGLLSGSIAGENTKNGGAITKSIVVGGSIYAYFPQGSTITGIVLQGKTDSVKIGGSVIGFGNAVADLRFTGYPFSSPAPKNAADATALSKLSIGGDLVNANIISGYDGAGGARGDASIGSITINGSVLATNIIAAVGSGTDSIFGTADDTLFSPRGTGIVPTLGPITIKGQLLGSYGGQDGYVITAAIIKSLKVGTIKIPLDGGAPDEILNYGSGRDITIREVSIA